MKRNQGGIKVFRHDSKRPLFFDEINPYTHRNCSDDFIGRGSEGTVRGVELVKHEESGQTRLRLAEKKYHISSEEYIREKFQLAHEIIELNKSKKLGLRIAEPMLRERNGQTPTILTPYMDTPLSTAAYQNMDWFADAARQEKILRKNGYSAHIECFFMIINPETGKAEAVIGEFGGLTRIKN